MQFMCWCHSDLRRLYSFSRHEDKPEFTKPDGGGWGGAFRMVPPSVNGTLMSWRGWLWWGRVKLDQKAFHDYGFFLISSSQSKSNGSSSSSGKVKRDVLERLSFSVDVSS